MIKRKLYIIDKNPELIDSIKEMLKDIEGNLYFDVIAICDDAITQYKELSISDTNLCLCTASNPQFSPDGGFDAAIIDYIADEIQSWGKRTPKTQLIENTIKQFNLLQPFQIETIRTGCSEAISLFPLISVDSSRQSNQNILMNNFFAILGNLKRFSFVLTGIGTGVGGVSITTFTSSLKLALLGNFSSVSFNKGKHSETLHLNFILKDLDFNNINLDGAYFYNVTLECINFFALKPGIMRFRNCKILHNLIKNSFNEKLLFELCATTMSGNRFVNDVLGLELWDGSYFVNNSLSHCEIHELWFTEGNNCIAHNNFSGSKLLFYNPKEILDTFEFTEEGLIGYKVFNVSYNVPPYWEIKKGNYIEEQVDTNIFNDCSNGINFGNKGFFKNTIYKPIWKVLVELKDLCTITVPVQKLNDRKEYKIRAGRVKLLKKLSENERKKLIGK